MKWTELVGQEKVKMRLDFHFDAYLNGEAMPSFIFCASRGFGKSTFAESFGFRLKEASGGLKRLISLNCASVKNLKQFWNSVVVPHINDRDVTLHLDEASELPDDVTMALLTMINPNEHNRNSYTYDDQTVDVDLKRQTFMFSTTEPHKIFHALMSRCRRIDFDDYSLNDLGVILKRNSKGVSYETKVLPDITSTLRGNAREAVKMAKDIKTYLSPLKRDAFTMDDWKLLSNKLNINPLGIMSLELQVMRVLADKRDCSLTRIAATLGMTPAAVQRDLELYLQKTGMMEITTTGRNLTPKGQQYLKDLDAVKKGKP